MCLPPRRDWENYARDLNIALHKSIPSELDLGKRRHCPALPAVSSARTHVLESLTLTIGYASDHAS